MITTVELRTGATVTVTDSHIIKIELPNGDSYEITQEYACSILITGHIEERRNVTLVTNAMEGGLRVKAFRNLNERGGQ